MQKLVKQSDPNVHWPEPRRAHSSAVISSRTVSNGVLKHYLLVLGGESDVDSSTPITNDCWVMDMDSKHGERSVIIIDKFSEKIISVMIHKRLFYQSQFP